MSCRNLIPFLEPFVDGELQPERVIEVEQHLNGCASCVERVRLSQALRASVKRTVRVNSEPTDAFRARLAAAIEAAHQRELDVNALERQMDRGRLLSWHTILPVAAAAVLTMVWAASTNNEQQHRASRTASSYAQVAPTNVDDLIEDLLKNHVSGRSEASAASLLPEMEREVGVPVHIPSLKQYGAKWEGGSVVPLKNQRAALLRYKIGGHRMTVYVYDSSRVSLERHLQRRRVGESEVYVGTRRGYSIGAADRRGVGYALATDLSDNETAELVAALN